MIGKRSCAEGGRHQLMGRELTHTHTSCKSAGVCFRGMQRQDFIAWNQMSVCLDVEVAHTLLNLLKHRLY